MSIYNLFSERVILPVSDLVVKSSISRNLRELMDSQHWTREQIDEYQNEKLKELICHCYQNVPFYRELMMKNNLVPSDITKKDDLYKLPITTKEDLRKARGKHLATNMASGSFSLSCSSGSTGEPFQYYLSKEAASMNTASAIRGWYWNGYRLGDKYVKISMNPRSSIFKRAQDYINRCRYLSSTQLIAASFSQMEAHLSIYDPRFLRGYPIPLLFLAELIEEKHGKYPGKSLQGINTTGSTLHNEARMKIEEVFQAKIFDSYSCEGGAGFNECPICGSYHPAEEYAISEFISDSFTKDSPDHPMRHITTDLINYASPFIRYDSQDYVVVRDRALWNPCSRNFIQVHKILGRDSDILITPSRTYLIVENVVAYFEYIPEVDLIQVVQNKLDQIEINLIVNDSYSPLVHQKILGYWQHYIGEDVHVSLNIVDNIKLTPTGKRRTVIRNPSISLNG